MNRDDALSLPFTAHRPTSLHGIAKFRLATHVCFNSTTTITALAKASGIDKNNYDHLIRHAFTNCVFIEETPSVIKQSAMP
jgi:hypothetical protein